ncbi:HD domain-containing protein [Clostridium sp. OM07-10AC]|nr:HD domain-containing protein [Clostridium sp. OM07-9AC]RHV08234.1 HD domain-containing protein [Clostridium sp. OM07-10AC]
MDEKRLEQQIAFCREIDKEKFIGRQTWLTGATRKENDAEHAWHMAVMTVLLSEYANEEIDVLRTMTMLLIHDLVEIYAGDTYAYDEEGKKTQKRRELAAADRLFQMLPEDQGKKFREIWEEFEAENTPESRFARTMDNLQPMMLNAATDGKSWADRGIRLSQILGRNKNTAKGSEVLWEYAKENFLQPNLEKGRIVEDVPLKI